MTTGDPKDLLNSGGSLHSMASSYHSNDKGGYHSPHHLIEIKEPPASVVALRKELEKPENRDIYDYASQGTDFADCMGRIALKLSIALDGEYDGADLCGMLVNAMRARKVADGTGRPHLGDSRLVEAEIVEKESGELSLEKKK